MPSPIGKITTLKPFVHKNEKRIIFFLFTHFLKRKVWGNFGVPHPSSLKTTMEEKKFVFFLKRKIDRKFWKLSAPSQIVAGSLRLKHNFFKNYIVPLFFLKNKIGRDFLWLAPWKCCPLRHIKHKIKTLKKNLYCSSNFFEK